METTPGGGRWPVRAPPRNGPRGQGWSRPHAQDVASPPFARPRVAAVGSPAVAVDVATHDRGEAHHARKASAFSLSVER